MSEYPLELQADRAAAARDFGAARDFLRQLVAAVPDHFDGWLKLSAMERALGDGATALATLDRALALRPLDFTALLMRATQLYGLGRESEAGEAYGRALIQAPTPAPQPLVAVLETARLRYQKWQHDQADAMRAAVIGARSASLETLITNAARLTAPDRDGPSHYCYPGLAEIAFHNRADFDWLCELESLTSTILREFETVISAQAAELVPYIQYSDSVPLDQWKALNQSRDWTAIHLLERGRVIEANARHCPELMRFLAILPQPKIRGAGPNAMFSLLAPGTHIPPHTGIANTRLVCHLPLVVPEGCWFRVGSDTQTWEQGKAWVFDDTVEHEAMNPTDRLRVILIFDIWHPELKPAERDAVAAVIGAGGRIHGL